MRITSEPSVAEAKERSMRGLNAPPSPSQLLGEAQAEIRDLKCALQDKELLIQSRVAEVEEKKKTSVLQIEAEVQSRELNSEVEELTAQSKEKRSSQWQSETQAEIMALNNALQEKELAIQSIQAEVEAEKRIAQAQIRELNSALQDKEVT